MICSAFFRQCSDLLSQAQYHVARARKIDEEEQELRKHREEEKEALRQKFEEDKLEKQKKKVEMDRMMMEKRAIFVEKAKQIVLEPEPEDRPKTKSQRVSIVLLIGNKVVMMMLMDRMMMEKRAIFVEKVKKIVLEPEPEDRPKTKSQRVSVILIN